MPPSVFGTKNNRNRRFIFGEIGLTARQFNGVPKQCVSCVINTSILSWPPGFSLSK